MEDSQGREIRGSRQKIKSKLKEGKMKMRNFLKAWMVVALMVSLVAVGNIGAVYANGSEPPGPGECTAGPKIKGVLTLSDNGDMTLNGTFRGGCKGESVKKNFCYLEYFVDGFANITKENLLYFRLYFFGPEGCRSFCGGEDLIINKVISFRNTGTEIRATVELLYLVYEGCPEF